MAISLSIKAVQNSQSISGNYSNVTVIVSYSWTNGSWNHNGAWLDITIDGESNGGSTVKLNPNKTNSGTAELGRFTTNVSHNSDGKKTVNYSAWCNTGISSGTVEASGSKVLTQIPREAKLTSAENFNDEDNPLIKYDNPAGNSSSLTLQAAIYSGNGSTAYAAYRNIPKNTSSYAFELTDTERNALRNACKDANSMSVRFYIRSTIGGTTYTSYLTKTMSIVNANPTITPTITDTNAVTATLTGDSNKLIRYFSNANIKFGASALKGASIVSRKVTCGSATLTADGTINAIESGSFKFTVTDSRGNSTTKTINKDIVNYIRLTSSFSNVSFSTDGDIRFNIKGNYFDSSFGTTSNLLLVQYRIKAEGGSYGNWVNTNPTISDTTYTFPVTISGLDYRTNYVIELKAIDELTTIQTERIFTCVPVFGWSKNDFEINVPLVMPNNNRINATTTDGTILNAFQPANQNNNLVIGYGAYTEGIGATNIYGNDINILTNTDLTVNDGTVYSILGAMKALTTVYELDCTVTAGSGYSNCSATAFLIGNSLRMYMTCSRSSNANSGDITNETVMTIKVKHNGKIKSLYGTGFASATTGAPSTFYSAAETFDDNNHTITVSMCGVSVADNGWSGYWVMPCSLDLSMYI